MSEERKQRISRMSRTNKQPNKLCSLNMDFLFQSYPTYLNKPGSLLSARRARQPASPSARHKAQSKQSSTCVTLQQTRLCLAHSTNRAIQPIGSSYSTKQTPPRLFMPASRFPLTTFHPLCLYGPIALHETTPRSKHKQATQTNKHTDRDHHTGG